MKTMVQRIADRVVVAETGCWLWTGAKAGNGYGSVRIKGKSRSAHAATYAELVGRVPRGKLLMHTCDRRACVNPAHLRVGTAAENTADMMRKGRHSGHQLRLDLSDEAVTMALSMCSSGVSQQAVANAFGISQTTVSKLVRGLWRGREDGAK